MEFLHLNATYGRLEQQELHLRPGLNVICAPNESGKSTWSAFIRTMLYGLSTRDRGPLADKNRYAPWSGAAMQGRMDLLADGETRAVPTHLWADSPAPTPAPPPPWRDLPR